MPYPERIYDDSYISPSGDEILFDFEVVSRDITHRIGAFEFSGVNGTLHQDKGISGEIYHSGWQDHLPIRSGQMPEH